MICGLAAIGAFSTSAKADSVGPITFESPAYTTGNIDGQNGWTNTGYDATVQSVTGATAALYPSFGGQSFQLSDAVTSGNFAGQPFSPALSQPAGESALSHFALSFQIGTVAAGDQPGLHMTVSPDDGTGSRMSFLRFEDQADGVHVLFEDATDPGPLGTTADFHLYDIATLPYGSPAHTIGLGIDFIPGPGNDVVDVSIDGAHTFTGTTWEDYYRYDPEQNGNGNVVPSVSKLLFRESGTANTADQGNGFLVDNLLMSSSATASCVETGFVRDGINLTAAQIGGTVTGSLNATGCNIGAYNPTSVTNADISGANYFGVVNNGHAVNVTSSSIHDIGETPLNGTQHGNAIYFANDSGHASTGVIKNTTITHYQKGGIVLNGVGSSATISGNTVTGEGRVNYIAQNGIEVLRGAKATITGNTVSGNDYTGPAGASSAGILVFGSFDTAFTTGVAINNNVVTRNDVGVWLFNVTASNGAPKTATSNTVKFNTISNNAITNTSGFDGVSCGYQAGVSDLGTKDSIVNNTISGAGYTRVPGDCAGTPSAFVRRIDVTTKAHGTPSNK